MDAGALLLVRVPVRKIRSRIGLITQGEITAQHAVELGAQRDRVIASYQLLSATGRLDIRTLGLKTSDYLLDVHYHQVRDAWHGLRTPSGQ